MLVKVGAGVRLLFVSEMRIVSQMCDHAQGGYVPIPHMHASQRYPIVLLTASGPRARAVTSVLHIMIIRLMPRSDDQAVSPSGEREPATPPAASPPHSPGDAGEGERLG